MIDAVLYHSAGVPAETRKKRFSADLKKRGQISPSQFYQLLIIFRKNIISKNSADKHSQKHLIPGCPVLEFLTAETACDQYPVLDPGHDKSKPVKLVDNIGPFEDKIDGRNRFIRDPRESARQRQRKVPEK